MENEKLPVDLQAFIDQLRLAMQVSAKEDMQELAWLIDKYGRICQQVNARLRDCCDHIDRGQYANAVALCEREPNLLNMAAILEIPERDMLAAAASCAGTRAPTLLSRESVGIVQEAHQKGEKSSGNLSRLHGLTLMRAPLPTRLAVMRQLQINNANHPFLDADIRHFEKTWFTRAVDFASSHSKAGRSEVVAEVLQDLEQSGYLETPPPAVLASLRKLLAKAQAMQLPALAEEIRQQMLVRSPWLMKPLIERWYATVEASNAPADSAEKLGVATAIAWYEQALADSAAAEETHNARERFERLLQTPKIERARIEAGYANLAAVGGVDAELSDRYFARLAEFDRNKSRRSMLLVGAAALAVCLAAGAALQIWQPSRGTNEVAAALAKVESLVGKGDYAAVIAAIDDLPANIAQSPALSAARQSAADKLAAAEKQSVEKQPPNKDADEGVAAEPVEFAAALAAIEQSTDEQEFQTRLKSARRLASNDAERARLDPAERRWQEQHRSKSVEPSPLAEKAAQLAKAAESLRDSARRGRPVELADTARLRDEVEQMRHGAERLGRADTLLTAAVENLAAAEKWNEVTSTLTQLDAALKGQACDRAMLERIAHSLSEEVAPVCPDEKVAVQARLALPSLPRWREALRVQEMFSTGESVPSKTVDKWKNDPLASPLSTAATTVALFRQRDPQVSGSTAADLKAYLARPEFTNLWVLRRQGQTNRYYVDKQPDLTRGGKSTNVFVLLDLVGTTSPIEFRGVVKVDRAPQTVIAERIVGLWQQPDAMADGPWHKLLATQYDALLDNDEQETTRDMEDLVKLQLVEKMLRLASATSLGFCESIDGLPEFKLTEFLAKAKRLTTRSAVSQGQWLDPAKLQDERRAAAELLKQAPRLTELAGDAAQIDAKRRDDIKQLFAIVGWLTRDKDGNPVLSRFSTQAAPLASRLYTLVEGTWLEIGKTSTNKDQLNAEAETYIGWPVFAVRVRSRKGL